MIIKIYFLLFSKNLVFWKINTIKLIFFITKQIFLSSSLIAKFMQMEDKLSELRATRHWNTGHTSKLTECRDCVEGKIHSSNVIPHFIGTEQEVQELVELANPSNDHCSSEQPCDLGGPRKQIHGFDEIDEWCIHTIALEWDPRTNLPVGIVLPIRHHGLFKEWASSYGHSVKKFPKRMLELKCPLNCYVIDVLQMVTKNLAKSKMWRVDPTQQTKEQKPIYRNQHFYYFVSLAAGDGTTGKKRFGTKKWRGPNIQILGGKIEHDTNETYIEAAAREFHEETHGVFCSGETAKFDGGLNRGQSIQIVYAQYCRECTINGTRPVILVKRNHDNVYYQCGCKGHRNLFIFHHSAVTKTDFSNI